MPEFIKDKAEFDSIIGAGGKVAVDFTASWCPPCQMIGPKFVAMSEDPAHADIKFYKVDVDENAETAEAAGIEAMPTFIFYHGGNKVSDMRGANEAGLKQKLEEL